MNKKEKIDRLCELRCIYSHGIFEDNLSKKEMETEILKITVSILSFNSFTLEELRLLKNTIDSLEKIIANKE